MSMVVQCLNCKQNFRKFSMKSNENKCEECKSRYGRQSGNKNVYGQVQNRREKEATTFISRLEVMESQFTDFKVTVDTTMGALRADVDSAISEQYTDALLQEKVDAYMGKLKDSLAVVNTRASTSFKKVDGFEKKMKKLAKRITLLEKKVNKDE